MRIFSRRSILSSSSASSYSILALTCCPPPTRIGPLLQVLPVPPPVSLVPDWLSPEEQNLLQDILNNDQGVSLRDLQQTSFQSIRDCISQHNTGTTQVVLIGDATHGTQEFYEIRSELTKALLTDGGFDAVLCEGDVGPFMSVNQYVVGIDDDNDDIASLDDTMSCLNNRFPTWMWDNAVVGEFVQWLREINNNLRTEATSTQPVQLLGMDIYSLFESMEGVLEYWEMYGTNDDLHAARQYYKTLLSFRPDPKTYGKAIFNNAVESQETNVRSALNMVERHETKPRRHASTTQSRQDALQNARAVVAGESYFRISASMNDRRQNAVATWNLRDHAFLENMQDTIAFLKQQKAGINNSAATPVRVVVWAHNSHVGDVRATDHVTKGYTNLCQLCRQAFGADSVYSIGMTTYKGSVRASKEWGGPDGVMKLAPAFEGSHEYLLHTIAKSRKENGVGFSLSGNNKPSDTAVQDLFSTDRVERFVGVSYTPETELQSHYNICSLSRQFDFVIHVDKSTALRVDSARRGSRAIEKEEKAMEDSAVSSKWDSMLLDTYGGSADYMDLLQAPIDDASE